MWCFVWPGIQNAADARCTYVITVHVCVFGYDVSSAVTWVRDVLRGLDTERRWCWLHHEVTLTWRRSSSVPWLTSMLSISTSEPRSTWWYDTYCLSPPGWYGANTVTLLLLWKRYVQTSVAILIVVYTHTHTRLTALCPGLPGWAGTRKVKPVWILLKQETVSGSGISLAICKSAPRSRQITMPAPRCSVFYRPDALPAAQPTVSKHWMQCRF